MFPASPTQCLSRSEAIRKSYKFNDRELIVLHVFYVTYLRNFCFFYICLFAQYCVIGAGRQLRKPPSLSATFTIFRTTRVRQSRSHVALCSAPWRGGREVIFG
jgi:hypothetical protein